MLGWLNNFASWWRRNGAAEIRSTAPNAAAESPPQIKRIVLADGVARTLFEDYADHRRSPRGDEEIGWILLGLRHEGEAIALAALPAGTQRDAGAAHVLFNSDVQELASHILRQQGKKLGVVGVVHTHPSDLRHPSAGDYQGDRVWVAQLRGEEGVFGIGTVNSGAESPSPHQQSRDDMSFCWYVLAPSDSHYRAIPVHLTNGPDLASPFHELWHILEAHAPALNRLYRQLARIHCQRIEMDAEILLAVKIALAEKNQQLRLLLNEAQARYYWDRGSELISIDPQELQVDRAVYLILAELAKESAVDACETLAPVRM